MQPSRSSLYDRKRSRSCWPASTLCTLSLTTLARPPGIRLKAVAAAKITSERAAATTAQLRQKVEEKDWTKEREYLGRTQKNLQGCGC